MKISSQQSTFLASIAEKIPRLFAAIADGNMRAEFILGNRILRGKRVRLKLVAEVIEPGGSPLATHSKPMPGAQGDLSDSEASADISIVSTTVATTICMPPHGRLGTLIEPDSHSAIIWLYSAPATEIRAR